MATPPLRAMNAEIPQDVDFFGHPSAVRVPAMKPRDGIRFVLSLNQYVMAQELAAKTEAPSSRCGRERGVICITSHFHDSC